MKIVYGRQLNFEENKRVQEIADQCGITFDTARLLFYRKQDTVEKAKRFLNPNKKYFHTPQKNQNITLIMQRYKKNRYQHLILLNIFRNLILSFTHSNLHPTFKQENGHFHTSHLQSLQSVYFSYRKIYHKKPTLQLQSCKVQINL